MTLDQLKFAFKNDPEFNTDLSCPHSELYNLLTCAELQVSEDAQYICVFKLLMIALILCPGSPDLKARIFYDMLVEACPHEISFEKV